MSFDDANEIKRLRRELAEVTAERDYFLSENRRLSGSNLLPLDRPKEGT